MTTKWIALPTPEDAAKLHTDMIAHGYVVVKRERTLGCIPAKTYGRARLQGTVMIIEEALSELECIRTLYDVVYGCAACNDMSL